jgi:hypothetical protein
VLEIIRDNGPTLLVPAAWLAAAAAVAGVLGETGMLIAHAVMASFITFFAVTGWSAMSTGAFRAWRMVMVLGLPVTLAGLAGFFVDSGESALWSVSLVGWMVLPASGLAYTAREMPEARRLYGATALLSLAGAVVAVAALLLGEDPVLFAGIGLVALGQTMGIVDAARRDR